VLVEQRPDLVGVLGLQGRLQGGERLLQLLLVLREGLTLRRRAARQGRQRQHQGHRPPRANPANHRCISLVVASPPTPAAGQAHSSPARSCITPCRSATACHSDRLASAAVRRVALRLCSAVSTSLNVTWAEPAWYAFNVSSSPCRNFGSTSCSSRSAWRRAAL